MKPKLILVSLCLTGLALGLLPAGAQTVPDEERAGIVQAATADADKALQANEQNMARFHLLAVLGVACDDTGWRDVIPKEVQQPYEAAAARAWPGEKIAADKEKEVFDALKKVVKPCAEKLTEAYPNVVNVVGSLSHSSTREMADTFLSAAKKHGDAMQIALEFVAQSPSPAVYNKFAWQGGGGFDAASLLEMLYNLRVGPSLVAKCAKENLLPAALKDAEEWLARAGKETDPDSIMADLNSVRTPLDWAVWADPDNARAKELAGKVKETADRAGRIRAQQIKNNRVPKEAYGGGDSAALKAEMRAAYLKSNPDAKVSRISIYGANWAERAIATSTLNTVRAGIFRLIDAAVVTKEGTRMMVHPITFAREWTGTGDKFGALKVHSWSDAYEVLPANLDK